MVTRQAISISKIRQARRDAGLCIACGAPAGGKYRCPPCAAAELERQAVWRRRLKKSMTEFPPKKLIGTLDAVHTALEPLSVLSRAIDSDPGMRALLSATNRFHETFRLMLGPIEDLRRSGLLDTGGQLSSELAGIGRLAAAFQKRYRLPALTETVRLLQSPAPRAPWKTLDRNSEQIAGLQRAAASLSAPWLDSADALRSMSGFCELQGVGRQLRLSTAFDPSIADRLRLVLGDWRDSINWPAPIFDNPFARSAFYRERGLDSALTGFPAAAFDQIAASAGIKDAPPTLLSKYCQETVSGAEDEETGFERTNAAHDRLQRFETHMRRFVEQTMRAAFGDDWIRQRVPPMIWKNWGMKLKKARDNGEPERPLVAYADFTDYEPIILRKDNWKEVFRIIFKRRTLVQESFQRLYPIRVCTMHARIITQDDELYLYVETKRLLAVIGIAS